MPKLVTLKHGMGTIDLDAKPVGVKHFTWAEVTRNGERLPISKAIFDNTVRMAKHMDKVREHFGRPITITSWYRPPAVNRAVGGARNSMHLTGLAVDFLVAGLTPAQVQAEILKTPSLHLGGLGLSPHFTHIDLGAKRQWRYGR